MRRVKFLDSLIQEQSNLRCLHRRISSAGEKISKCPFFGIRGAKTHAKVEEVEMGSGIPPRNPIGRNVSRLRSEQDWSQEHLATLLQCEGVDTSRDMLARIELCITRVNLEFLLGLQRVFRCPSFVFSQSTFKTWTRNLPKRSPRSCHVPLPPRNPGANAQS